MDRGRKFLTILGSVVVTLFAVVLASTLLAILFTPGDRAGNLLKLLEVLMGWEELLAVVLGGIAVGYNRPLSRYLDARSKVLEWEGR